MIIRFCRFVFANGVTIVGVLPGDVSDVDLESLAPQKFDVVFSSQFETVPGTTLAEVIAAGKASKIEGLH